MGEPIVGSFSASARVTAEKQLQVTCTGVRCPHCSTSFTFQVQTTPAPELQKEVELSEELAEELDSAEGVLDGYATELGLVQTDFETLGDYIKAVVGALQARGV